MGALNRDGIWAQARPGLVDAIETAALARNRIMRGDDGIEFRDAAHVEAVMGITLCERGRSVIEHAIAEAAGAFDDLDDEYPCHPIGAWVLDEMRALGLDVP